MRTTRNRLIAALGAAMGMTAVVIISLASPAAAAPLATTRTARPAAVYEVAGEVTDPGITISDVTPAGALVRFTATGGSHWSGDLEGDTTYRGPAVFDPATGDSDMFLHETFTGTLASLGAGRLDCIDVVHQNADGSGSLELWVVRGHGRLRGLHGHIHFSWSAMNPDGSVDGRYQGVLYRL